MKDTFVGSTALSSNWERLRGELEREPKEWQGNSTFPVYIISHKLFCSERKAEREREHSRHAASLKQLEHSLNSRERMYKERILGLEEQVRLSKIIKYASALLNQTFLAICGVGEPPERAAVKRSPK